MRQPLQILVDAIPNAALRPLLIELLQNGAMPAPPPTPDAAETTTPATRRRGWPRGKPRKTAAAGETAAERTARLARHAAAQRRRDSEKRRQKLSSASGNGNGGTGSAAALAAKLWQRATTLSPSAPWKAVVQEFGVNSALALDHFRRRSLPPVAHAAVTRFVETAPAS